MKKILQCLLAVFLGLGVIQTTFVHVQAEEPIRVAEGSMIKSFYFEDLPDEIDVPSTIKLKYDAGEAELGILELYLVSDSSRVINVSGQSSEQEEGTYNFYFDDRLRYDNYSFLCLVIINNMGNMQFISNKTSDDLDEYLPYTVTNENVFGYHGEVSIKIKDVLVDRNKPTIEDLKVEYDDKEVTISFKSNETKESGLLGANFYFMNNNSEQIGADYYGEDLVCDDDKYVLKYTIEDFRYFGLTGDQFDEFKLTGIVLSDRANNYQYYGSYEGCIPLPEGDFHFAVNNKNNPYIDLKKEDIKIETNYFDNCLHYRKGAVLPEGDDLQIYYLDENGKKREIIFDLGDYLHVYRYVASKITDTNQSEVTVQVPFKVNRSDTEPKFYIPVKVVFDELVGTVVSVDYKKEVALKYTDYKTGNFSNQAIFTVKLNSGEIIQETFKLKPGAMGSGVQPSEDGKHAFFEIKTFALPPKYDASNEVSGFFNGFSFKSLYFLVDDEGNLVDGKGNTVMSKQERINNTTTYASESNSVSMSSPLGSAPTDTILKVEETKIDEKNDYVAYDMSLDSYGFTIQPADDVTLSIDLPETLKDQEVEVYYVDDAGAKHLVEGSKAENGTITFDTDHFSTYAVIAKDNKPEEPEKPTEPEKPVEPEKPSQGNTEVDVPTVNPKEEVKEVTVGVEDAKKTEDILNESIKDDKVLGPLAEKAIQEGKDVNISAKPTLIDPTKVSAEVKKEIEKIIAETSKNDLIVAQYLDITIHVMADNEPLGNLTSTKEKLKFQIAVPEDLKKEGRTFIVFRIHDGKVEKLETVEKDGLLVFESDQFSTYALAYKDTETTKPSAPNTSDHLMILNFVVMTILSGLIFVVLKKRTSFEK